MAPSDRDVLRTLVRRGYRALRRATFHLSSARDAVLFAGDSLIDQWPDLESHFPGLKVINRGISGDTSRELLFRLKRDVLAYRPSRIVILIGTNDLAEGISPRRIAASISRMADDVRRFGGGVPIILCRVLPRTKIPGLFPDKIRALNGQIDSLAAKRKHVSVCDAFAPLANEDGSCREDLFTDGLHLNAAGYRTLAAVLKPSLSRPA